jgi:hypothetical protein
MHFVIIIYVIFVLQLSFLKSADNRRKETANQKSIQCKVCQEMFRYDFDYDKLIKDEETEKQIEKYFTEKGGGVPVNEDEEGVDKNKENSIKSKIEIMAKEISMQYFFKGGETQFETLINNQDEYKFCKNYERSKGNKKCEKIKNKVCEDVLGYENEQCGNKYDDKNLNEDLPVVKIKPTHTTYQTNSNLNTKNDSNSPIKINLQKNKIKNKNLNPQAQKEFFNFRSTDAGVNINNSLQSLNNFNKMNSQQHLQRSADPENPYANMSLLQLTPEYVSQNFDSVPKSHWQPPKPVLLQNFENSMGDQLKDISMLTS